MLLGFDRRNHAAARLLLDRGARFGAVNKDGKSALHIAMEIGDIGSAVMLLERGARVDTMDQVSVWEGFRMHSPYAFGPSNPAQRNLVLCERQGQI